MHDGLIFDFILIMGVPDQNSKMNVQSICLKKPKIGQKSTISSKYPNPILTWFLFFKYWTKCLRLGWLNHETMIEFWFRFGSGPCLRARKFSNGHPLWGCYTKSNFIEIRDKKNREIQSVNFRN